MSESFENTTEDASAELPAIEPARFDFGCAAAVLWLALFWLAVLYLAN